MTADTTTLHYWLNWRVLLCAIWVFSPMIAASILIRKYEGSDAEQHDREETQQKRAGTLYADESWRPCLKEIHPIWLLAFRIVAFLVLLTLLIINVVLDGGGVFYFYTQWTFALVTIYFGLGSLLSLYGCYQFLNKVGGDMVEQLRLDEERGTYVAPIHEGNANVFRPAKSPSHHEERYVCKISGIWGYVFQIIYQTSAGAATLTDVVFWLIIYPFLTAKDYRLNFLLAGMHSLNAVFLLGDAALNSLRFPWFRISYFVLWTAMFVIFQWVIHACVSLWWPYPFLDLSSPYAPLWYLMVALLHVPCYVAFPLIIKLKHNLLSRWFPHSHQFLK
ncbi:uncharacterized protein LOC131237848 [Magnolia sinica]|uniref:uncharacterized protein LOC131237848 n=1 Tax=Magnolia sinica TaxID=86752 RepID=UPI00265831D2|nr:uncharacterized protein LOC131237848 [Magnolia sinica]XP_058091847.1 uncharacterized protein LOC131237848 [Magnolia sinica]